MLIDIFGKHPDLDGFRFCRKIMRKYHPFEYKPHINHLCIKNGFAYSTDGSRLHSAKCHGQYDDGLWAVTVCRSGFVQIAKSQYGTSKFPDAEKIFDMTDYISLENGLGKSKHFPMDNNYHIEAVFRIMRYGIKVNPSFISDLNGDFKIFVTTKKDALDRKPVFFLNGNKRAAVMPLRNL